LHAKAAEEKRKKLYQETQSLGGFNPYSRPKPSVEYPNRSVLLDPKVNNFSPSKTRSELLKKIRVTAIPHESYDIVRPPLLLFLFHPAPHPPLPSRSSSPPPPPTPPPDTDTDMPHE
jgi:hypothetical protein